MALKKVKPTKNPAKLTAKAKKLKKANIVLSRVNVNIAKSLYNKIKRIALKNKITLQEIVSSAIKEYLNKTTSD